MLAGTYHSAESAFLESLPRPLAPVAQIPVVGYVLRWLAEAGVVRGTICANSGSRSIHTCVGDGASLAMHLDYVEDATPRGPAGCTRDAALRHAADTFVVVDGTVIPDLDLRGLVTAHRSSGAAVTAVVHSAVRDAAVGFQRMSPAGIYVFSRRALELVSPFGFQDIKEHLLPALRAAHERVVAYCSPQFCPRVLNAETYLAVNHWMIERLAANPDILTPWGPFSMDGELAVHPTASIHETARIIGPAILGAGVTIGANAVIVGPTSLGPRTRVAGDALVSRSVLWGDCEVGAHAFVDASIVGYSVVVPAGHIVQGEVKVERGSAPARGRTLPTSAPLHPATAESIGLAFP